MHPTPSTSASPGPFYRLRSTTQRVDGPSPSKRRKLATPAPASSSSSSFCDPNLSLDPQLDTERRASSSRVLRMWSALEEKYARSLDEDDIVDLRIGGLVKDRGVLSRKTGMWDIGCFADPKEAQAQADATQDDEDEDDEIGVWSSDAELDHRFNPVNVPPVRELDPEDAKDLRAFLAAEEARKALHGVDDGVSEDEAEINHKGAYDPNEHFDAYAETEESILEVEAGSPLALSPTESDDELAGYDETVGEGAQLWEVSTELSNCSEPLGIDNRTTPKPPPPPRTQTPAQLRTPPVSRSSMRPPIDPVVPKPSPRPSKRSFLNPPPPSPPESRKTPSQLSPSKKPGSTRASPEKRMATPEAPSSRPRRHSTSSSHRTSTDSTTSSPLHYASQHASSSRPPPLSRDFSPPYPRSAHSPAPVSPIPYPPLPNYTREASIPPHRDAQMHFAQAMQSLSYAFGVPPPALPLPHLPHHIHPPHTPSSSLHSPSPWPYSPPYYLHPSQPRTPAPPWPYPPYPYPYSYHYPSTSPGHPALPSSSATPLTTSGSGGEPPSSPYFASSPLLGKDKGKKVSFPSKLVQSESDSDVNSGPEVRKRKGKEKRKERAPNAMPSGRSRRDSKESPSSGSKDKGRENVTPAPHSEVSPLRGKKVSSHKRR